MLLLLTNEGGKYPQPLYAEVFNWPTDQPGTTRHSESSEII